MNLLLTLFTATLFVLLVPGVLFKIPAKGSLFVVAAVHGLLFALLYHCVFQLSLQEGFQDSVPTNMPVQCVNDPASTDRFGGTLLETGSILPAGTTFFAGTFFAGGNVLPDTDINKVSDPLSIEANIAAGTPFPPKGLAIATDITIPKGLTTTAAIYIPRPICGDLDPTQRWLLPRGGGFAQPGAIIPKGTTFAGTTTGKGHILNFDLPYVDDKGAMGVIPKDTRFTKMLTSTADIKLTKDIFLVQALIFPTGFSFSDRTRLNALLKDVVQGGSAPPGFPQNVYNFGVEP